MKKLFLTTFSGLYLILSLLIYIAVPSTNAHMENDSIGYEHQALQFYHNKTNNNMPIHTNGYPFFLALIYKFFGYTRALVILFQILLALCSGFLIFSIAYKLFNQTVALISFVLFSFNLGFLIFPQFILSEILLVFFLIFAIERLVAYMTNKSPPALAASGLLFGISIIVKPVALYYIFFLLPFLVYLLHRHIKIILLFLFCFYAPIVSYMTANKLMYDRFCVSSLVNANLYIWFHAKIKAVQNNTNHIEEMAHLSKTKNKEQFFDLIKQHPILAIKVWMREVLKSFAGLYTTSLKVLLEPNIRGGDVSFFNSKNQSIFYKAIQYVTSGTTSLTIKIICFFEAFWNLLRYLLVFIAFLLLYKQKKLFLLLFFSSYIFYFSMITGHDGCARYRLMFEFIFIILAALAIHFLYQKVRRVREHV